MFEDVITLMILSFMVMLIIVLAISTLMYVMHIQGPFDSGRKKLPSKIKVFKRFATTKPKEQKVFLVTEEYEKQVDTPRTQERSTIPFQIIEFMKWEKHRLASFSTCPDLLYPGFFIRLARAGWFYNSTNNETTCYSCCITHGFWTADDDPVDIHRSLSPGCEFFCQRSTNIAMQDDYSDYTTDDGVHCSMCRRGKG